jgi:hypothetical protein
LSWIIVSSIDVASDESIAARVEHYSHRVPFEFYDYAEDLDALHNRINDPALKPTIQSYQAKLSELMRKTNDPQRPAFEQAELSSNITRE